MDQQSPMGTSERRKFFISYTGHDLLWAEWIGAELERAGYTVFLQAWDILPGANLVLSLDQALRTQEHCVLVISPAYLQDGLAQAQWAAAFLRNPTSEHRNLLPVRVEPCKLEGLLASHVPIDLSGLDRPTASQRLLDWITAERLKPSQSPYPGQGDTPYPGSVPVNWNLPFRRNPHFTGREEQLATLRAHLRDGQNATIGQTEAISGLGGIGKTQLAVEYAWRHRAEYTHVFWVHAETTETLNASYSEIAGLLDLPEKTEQEQKRVVEAVKRWLRTHQHYLLILDNADTLSLLSAFLPADPTGHLLITTRSAHTSGAGLGLAEPLAMEVLTPELGAQLLLRRAGRQAQTTEEELAQTAELAKELGGLPLVLDQAGAYMARSRVSVARYQNLYKQYRVKLLQERQSAEYPASVVTTWSISFQAVEEQNQAAAELLRFCSFLAPEVIPESILTKGAEMLGSVLAPVAADALRLDVAIGVLRGYSLLEREVETGAMSVHRLVQVVVRDSLPANEQRIWKLRAMMAANASFPPVADFADWSICERLLPHAQQCSTWIEQDQLSSVNAAHLLNRVGYYLQDRGRYSEAESFLERALTICQYELGEDEHLTVAVTNNLAALYFIQGKHVKAEPLYRRALAFCEQKLGANHPHTAASLNNLAELYRAQGRYAAAEPLYRRALAIFERKPGSAHFQLSRNLNNLAELYRAQGKYAAAEPLYKRALAICERELGVSHPDTATSLNNLAELYRAQGKYAAAEPLYRRALAICERELGVSHPDTATSLNNLGLLYQAQRNYTEAEPLLKRALVIREQELGVSHPHTAASLNNLALLYQAQHNYTEAEPLLKQALTIDSIIYGAEHHEVAIVLINMAELYREQGRYAEAEPLSGQALAISINIFGVEHSGTLDAGERYTAILRCLGREKDAREVETLLRRKFTPPTV